jgi:Flp pilus assembly protein TadG
MKEKYSLTMRQSERGAVAVEAALCTMLILLPVVFFMFIFGKFFWYYTASQKAIHDATFYMARAPLVDIQARTAEVLALGIISQEIADFMPDTITEPTINCGYKVGNSINFRNCLTTGNPPVAVSASINLTVSNPFHAALNPSNMLQDINVFIALEMPYAGK